MKRILFLGATAMQIPPLRYAREQGHYVITADYKPDNPGHVFANEYHNVSTTDKSAVLELAKQLNIDAVIAYASDPAAPTAAFVGNELGLPSNPYSSVEILARKDLFRKFLLENNFNVPDSGSFYDIEEARLYAKTLILPVFIKPVDSSGSKGVTRLTEIANFDDAFSHALEFSREKKVVIEEQIVRHQNQVAGDGFVVDGKLVFRCWGNEHFDKLCNGLVPIGESFPAIHNEELLEIAHSETQRLLTLLGMKSGALNFDFVFTAEGKFYFLELGPRNGGNLIPEVTFYATGIDMVKYTVNAALGIDCSDLAMAPVKGYWASYIVHSLDDGLFDRLEVSERMKNKIVEQNILVKPGDQVNQFSGSHDTLGTMILRFDSAEEMLEMMDNMENDLRVVTC